MIVINVSKLSLSFGVNEIFSDVTFALNEGDHLGVIGVNGCGKSILFKLILGEYTPDSGDVFISKDKTVGILRQDGAFEEFSDDETKLSALEVMYLSFPELVNMEKKLKLLETVLSLGKYEEGRTEESYALEYTTLNDEFIKKGGLEFRGRCASTLQKMGFDEKAMNLPFSSLSGGQRTRLALSKELCREPDILLLDEPTNHLDPETQAIIGENFGEFKGTILLVSHNPSFVEQIGITRMLLLPEGKIVDYSRELLEYYYLVNSLE